MSVVAAAALCMLAHRAATKQPRHSLWRRNAGVAKTKRGKPHLSNIPIFRISLCRILQRILTIMLPPTAYSTYLYLLRHLPPRALLGRRAVTGVADIFLGRTEQSGYLPLCDNRLTMTPPLTPPRTAAQKATTPRGRDRWRASRACAINAVIESMQHTSYLPLVLRI